jgi:hypothetical protein
MWCAYASGGFKISNIRTWRKNYKINKMLRWKREIRKFWRSSSSLWSVARNVKNFELLLTFWVKSLVIAQVMNELKLDVWFKKRWQKFPFKWMNRGVDTGSLELRIFEDFRGHTDQYVHVPSLTKVCRKLFEKSYVCVNLKYLKKIK